VPRRKTPKVLEEHVAKKKSEKVDEGQHVVIEPVVRVISFDPSSDAFEFKREDDMRIADSVKIGRNVCTKLNISKL